MKNPKSYWTSLETSNTINVNGVEMTIRQYKAMMRKQKAERERTNKNV